MNEQQKYRDNLFYKSSGKKIQFAKNLRKNLTPAENKLWQILRGGKNGGHKFRRQHVIGKFVAYFYCHKSKLVVEADGEIHNLVENKNYDAERNLLMLEKGIKVLRFSNDEILNSIDTVVAKIAETLNKPETINLIPKPSPSPPGAANIQWIFERACAEE